MRRSRSDPPEEHERLRSDGSIRQEAYDKVRKEFQEWFESTLADDPTARPPALWFEVERRDHRWLRQSTEITEITRTAVDKTSEHKANDSTGSESQKHTDDTHKRKADDSKITSTADDKTSEHKANDSTGSESQEHAYDTHKRKADDSKITSTAADKNTITNDDTEMGKAFDTNLNRGDGSIIDLTEP